ncbi:MAG TPA: hypothetical protein VGH64_15545 [Puia sp.]
MSETDLKITSPSTWFIKFIECLFVSVAIWDFYNSMVFYPLIIKYRHAPTRLAPLESLNFVLTIATILFAIIYPLYWHRKEKAQSIDSARRHALFIGILRYWLALEICNYAFAKILETQFAHDYTRDNSLAGGLSGFDLTWFYFGYSYTLSVIVAILQIGGSVFLLFRRTVFLGVVILLPIMVNIVLIDIFYHIPAGAILNAGLFTLGLFYLLFLFRKELHILLSQVKNTLPVSSSFRLKNVLRVGVVVYAFLFILYFTTTESPKFLVGKWSVTQLIRNGQTAKANDWLTDSLAWTDIYLERWNQVTLSPNPYVIEAGRSQRGIYEYDKTSQTIKLMLWAGDTLKFRLLMPDDRHMSWTGESKKESVVLSLVKRR